MTRNSVLIQAVKRCLEELYTKVQPAVTWDEFLEESRLYNKAYNQWEQLYKEDPKKAGDIQSFCGPRPFEFYYLPKEVIKDIIESYVRAYKIDSQQELLDIIETLKNYCEDPIVDKYIEGKNGEPGHRGYDHPDNLEKEIKDLLKAYCDDSECDFSYVANEIVNKFFEFLDMAGNFYNWNRDLNAFYMETYLGPSPSSNKDAVINNWKKYRNKDIVIDDSVYIEDEE